MRIDINQIKLLKNAEKLRKRFQPPCPQKGGAGSRVCKDFSERISRARKWLKINRRSKHATHDE
jgi:hypothetical protein